MAVVVRFADSHDPARCVDALLIAAEKEQRIRPLLARRYVQIANDLGLRDRRVERPAPRGDTAMIDHGFRQEATTDAICVRGHSLGLHVFGPGVVHNDHPAIELTVRDGEATIVLADSYDDLIAIVDKLRSELGGASRTCLGDLPRLRGAVRAVDGGVAAAREPSVVTGCGKRFGRRRELVCRRTVGHPGQHAIRPTVGDLRRALRRAKRGDTPS